MLPEQQQRILGYFIEEAKDHLNTIEQGLLNLQTTLQDSEMVNEIFRAAHSIKGGAAMLGLDGIQRTSHRLEDFFKTLKECPAIQIDQNLESLFLKVFDNLQALLEQLQSPSGLTADVVNNLMSEVEPIFVALDQHLELLVNQAGGNISEEISFAVKPTAAASTGSLNKVAPATTTFGLADFQSIVLEQLRQMLQLFKQSETPETRQQLEACCQQLGQVGEQLNLSGWCTLCETAAGAIANPDNTYRSLASIIIKELKQAQELVLAGRDAQIVTCEQLQTLAIATFLFDWEDDNVNGERENARVVTPEVELPAANIADITAMTEEQLSLAAEDDLSSLFALKLDDESLLSETLDNLGTDAKEDFPQISVDETLALDSLFGEVQNTSLNFSNQDEMGLDSLFGEAQNTSLNFSSQEEKALYDLFPASEVAEESLDSLDLSTPAASTENSNLSFFWEEDSETPAEINFELEEFSLPFETEDELFAGSPETSAFYVNQQEVEASNVDEQITADLSNSGETYRTDDDSWDVELDLDLTSVLGMSPIDLTQLEQTVIDTTPTTSEITSELNLTSEFTQTDLFNNLSDESEPIDTFFESNNIAVDETAADLIAAFDLTTEEEVCATDVDLDDESNPVAMSAADMLLEAQSINPDSAEVAFVEVQALQIATEATDGEYFSDLEALLAQESVADVATNEVSLPSVVVNTDGTKSIDDEFDDLEKLLEESEPTDTALVQPQQKQVESVALQPQPKPATNNSRRSAFEQMMRVPVKHLDNVSNLVGELVVYRNSLEQDQERLRQFLENLLHQVQQLGDVGARMQELYERSLLEASLLNSRQSSRSPSLDDSATTSQHHATGLNFDALEMDRFTGFHTLAQEMIELIVRVREASSDIEFVTDETEQVARQFRQVTTQLQEGLTRSRMVTFSQIAERLPRAVRDISIKYGKQVQLQIEGQETLIDKMILEQLYDPMTHLVNNAITHGIETPQERSAKGKSPVGLITIRAFHQGNQTVITVSDDGAGIDAERVKAKAIQKGLITSEVAENMSRLEVYNLLFHAGFSTKDSVDEFAGRGVGMDVVLTSLNQIRGIINTDSTLGKGTTFTIRLPLTLSICKALCCLSDKARIAFPMDGVEQMLEIPAQSVITNAEGQTCIPWRDSLMPFRPLKELITYNRQLSRGNVYGSNREDDMISIVVLRSADAFLALQVDQVLSEQEIVIKQLEGPASKPVGIAGATVLGDGRIMPIADVLELMDLAMGRQQNAKGMWEQSNVTVPPASVAVKTEPIVLIVDDSITVRELLSMTFSNAGYRVEQARDGQEAWNKLRDGLPCDLVFCDIEMPRMDGLELLSRMQQEPRLSKLPIAMLTSRGSDRHRQMALQLGASGYFTKPYLEEALLDGAQRMLKGEVLVAINSNA